MTTQLALFPLPGTARAVQLHLDLGTPELGPQQPTSTPKGPTMPTAPDSTFRRLRDTLGRALLRRRPGSRRAPVPTTAATSPITHADISLIRLALEDRIRQAVGTANEPARIAAENLRARLDVDLSDETIGRLLDAWRLS